ncbi:MAG: phosphoribosyl-ATP diphosphatase, partial [Burkholderiales bacterium]
MTRRSDDRPGGVPDADPGAVRPSGSGEILERLAAIVESRKGADPARSYVAQLLAKGPDAILKKIGEEATETV